MDESSDEKRNEPISKEDKEQEQRLASLQTEGTEENPGASSLLPCIQEDEKKEVETEIRRILRGATFYEILDVNFKSTTEEIKRAYRKLAVLCHPDKCSSEHGQEAFIAITEACQKLCNPKERAEYDEHLSEQHGTEHGDRDKFSMDTAKSFFNEVLLGKVSSDTVNLFDIIQENLPRLRDKLNVDEMCLQLYSKKLISDAKFKEIKEACYPRNVDLLLDILLRKGFVKAKSIDIIKCFLDAGQLHLLCPEKGEPEKDQLIQYNYKLWTETLDPNEVGSYLKQENILTETEYYTCMAQTAPQLSMQSILDVLKKKPVEQFNQFYQNISQLKLVDAEHTEADTKRKESAQSHPGGGKRRELESAQSHDKENKPKTLPSVVGNIRESLLDHLKFDTKLYLALLAVDFPRYAVEQIQDMEKKEGREKAAKQLVKELENDRLTPKQLYTCLEYTDQTHLKEKMEDHAFKNNLSMEELSGCTSPSKLKVDLKFFYLENFDRVPYMPWDQSDMMPLSQVYVNLEFERQYRERNKIKKEKLDSYLEFFSGIPGSPNPSLIFVLGETGCGKTVCSKKFGFDWANGVEALQKFDFVFVLILRNWKKNETIEQMIWRDLFSNDPQFNCDMIKEILQVKNCALILDGLDEIQSHPSDLSSILEKESLKNKKVVVTTRPIGKDTVKKADVITVIKGFEPDASEKYTKYFFEDDEMYIGFQAEIENKGELLRISKIPLFLHLLCLLYNEFKELPGKLTAVYQKLEEYFVNRFRSLMKEKNELVDEAQIKALLNTQSYLAFKCQTENNSIIDDGQIKDSRMLFSLGFTISWKDPNNTSGLYKISFCHKSFQDFYSAKYLVNSHEGCKTFLKYCDTKEKILALKILFGFCCGIDGKTGADLLHKIQEKQVISDLDDLVKLQMQALCEIQEENIEGDLIDISSLQCYSYLHIDDNMYIPTVREFSPKKIVLRQLHIHEFTPTSLTVSNKEETSKKKSRQLSLHQLEEIYMDRCTVDKAAFWDEKLSESTSPSTLHTLELRFCKLSSGFLSALFSSPHLHHLTALNLSYITLGGKVSEAVDVLHHHHQQQHLSLEYLWMPGCHLTEGDIPGVVRLVELSPHMKDLNLHDNPDAGGEKLLPLLTLLEGRQDEMVVWVDVSWEEGEEWRRKLPQHKIIRYWLDKLNMLH